MNTLIVIGVSVIILAIMFLLKKKEKGLSLTLKLMVVLLLVTITVNSFFNDSFLFVINKGWKNGINYNAHDYMQTALRWMQSVSYVILPVAIFGKIRFYKNTAILFCLPVAILFAFYYKETMFYYTEVNHLESHGFVVPEMLRHILLTLELSLTIILAASPLIRGHLPKFKSLEPLMVIVALPFLLILQMPAYIPQSIMGYVTTDVPDIQVEWIGLTVFATLALIWLFRFKDRQTRLELSWVLALALFIYYNSNYLTGFSVRRLPFQLCNMASIFILLVMVFNRRGFFSFVFLANVAGTIIAMILPEAAESFITSFSAVRYMYQHSLVLLVPCVIMGLRIFPRLTGRSMIHAAIGFFIYWLFALIFGAYVNANPEIFDGTTLNLFYLFDMEIIGYIAPWAAKTFTEITILGMKFRPIIQVLVLFVFYGITCLLFLVVINLQKLSDDHLVLRKKLIEIYEKKTGKKCKLKTEFIE